MSTGVLARTVHRALIVLERGRARPLSATSTTRARRWAMAGRPMHHLLDPLTGLPVKETWRTVTVAAATCLDEHRLDSDGGEGRCRAPVAAVHGVARATGVERRRGRRRQRLA